MDNTRDDDLIEAARVKFAKGEKATKEEVNAYMAASLFNPTNQVYFRAGLIACREYMARFVEAQSPEVAASIRANWWPVLGPDFGPPRLMRWEELVDGGEDGPPIKIRDDISPTLEALPIALHFLQTPEPAPVACTRGVMGHPCPHCDAPPGHWHSFSCPVREQPAPGVQELPQALAEQCAEHGSCSEKAQGNQECVGRCKAEARADGVEGNTR